MRAPAAGEGRCPGCREIGRPVPRATVGALARLEVDAARLSAKDYRFCETRACPVVYFSASGAHIDRGDLRVAVHQKDDGPQVPLCYCFAVTRARLAREGGAAVAFVTAEVKACRCACDVKNPSGRCCLGDLRRFVRPSPAGKPRPCPSPAPASARLSR